MSLNCKSYQLYLIIFIHVFDASIQMPSLQMAVERENLIRTLIIEAKEDGKSAVSAANIFENIVPNRRVPKLLASEGISRSSYSCVVLDAPEGPKTFQYKCAVFLVPKVWPTYMLCSTKHPSRYYKMSTSVY